MSYSNYNIGGGNHGRLSKQQTNSYLNQKNYRVNEHQQQQPNHSQQHRRNEQTSWSHQPSQPSAISDNQSRSVGNQQTSNISSSREPAKDTDEWDQFFSEPSNNVDASQSRPPTNSNYNAALNKHPNEQMGNYGSRTGNYGENGRPPNDMAHSNLSSAKVVDVGTFNQGAPASRYHSQGGNQNQFDPQYRPSSTNVNDQPRFSSGRQQNIPSHQQQQQQQQQEQQDSIPRGGIVGNSQQILSGSGPTRYSSHTRAPQSSELPPQRQLNPTQDGFYPHSTKPDQNSNSNPNTELRGGSLMQSKSNDNPQNREREQYIPTTRSGKSFSTSILAQNDPSSQQISSSSHLNQHSHTLTGQQHNPTQQQYQFQQQKSQQGHGSSRQNTTGSRASISNERGPFDNDPPATHVTNHFTGNSQDQFYAGSQSQSNSHHTQSSFTEDRNSSNTNGSGDQYQPMGRTSGYFNEPDGNTNSLHRVLTTEGGSKFNSSQSESLQQARSSSHQANPQPNPSHSTHISRPQQASGGDGTLNHNQNEHHRQQQLPQPHFQQNQQSHQTGTYGVPQHPSSTHCVNQQGYSAGWQQSLEEKGSQSQSPSGPVPYAYGRGSLSNKSSIASSSSVSPYSSIAPTDPSSSTANQLQRRLPAQPSPHEGPLLSNNINGNTNANSNSNRNYSSFSPTSVPYGNLGTSSSNNNSSNNINPISSSTNRQTNDQFSATLGPNSTPLPNSSYRPLDQPSSSSQSHPLEGRGRPMSDDSNKVSQFSNSSNSNPSRAMSASVWRAGGKSTATAGETLHGRDPPLMPPPGLTKSIHHPYQQQSGGGGMPTPVNANVKENKAQPHRAAPPPSHTNSQRFSLQPVYSNPNTHSASTQSSSQSHCQTQPQSQDTRYGLNINTQINSNPVAAAMVATLGPHSNLNANLNANTNANKNVAQPQQNVYQEYQISNPTSKLSLAAASSGWGDLNVNAAQAQANPAVFHGAAMSPSTDESPSLRDPHQAHQVGSISSQAPRSSKWSSSADPLLTLLDTATAPYTTTGPSSISSPGSSNNRRTAATQPQPNKYGRSVTHTNAVSREDSALHLDRHSNKRDRDVLDRERDRGRERSRSLSHISQDSHSRSGKRRDGGIGRDGRFSKGRGRAGVGARDAGWEGLDRVDSRNSGDRSNSPSYRVRDKDRDRDRDMDRKRDRDRETGKRPLPSGYHSMSPPRNRARSTQDKDTTSSSLSARDRESTLDYGATSASKLVEKFGYSAIQKFNHLSIADLYTKFPHLYVPADLVSIAVDWSSVDDDLLQREAFYDISSSVPIQFETTPPVLTEEARAQRAARALLRGIESAFPLDSPPRFTSLNAMTVNNLLLPPERSQGEERGDQSTLRTARYRTANRRVQERPVKFNAKVIVTCGFKDNERVDHSVVKKLRVLCGRRKGGTVLLGGPWCKELDGGDPLREKDRSCLRRTARRCLLAQSLLDIGEDKKEEEKEERAKGGEKEKGKGKADRSDPQPCEQPPGSTLGEDSQTNKAPRSAVFTGGSGPVSSAQIGLPPSDSRSASCTTSLVKLCEISYHRPYEEIDGVVYREQEEVTALYLYSINQSTLRRVDVLGGEDFQRQWELYETRVNGHGQGPSMNQAVSDFLDSYMAPSWVEDGMRGEMVQELEMSTVVTTNDVTSGNAKANADADADADADAGHDVDTLAAATADNDGSSNNGGVDGDANVDTSNSTAVVSTIAPIAAVGTETVVFIESKVSDEQMWEAEGMAEEEKGGKSIEAEVVEEGQTRGESSDQASDTTADTAGPPIVATGGATVPPITTAVRTAQVPPEAQEATAITEEVKPRVEGADSKDIKSKDVEARTASVDCKEAHTVEASVDCKEAHTVEASVDCKEAHTEEGEILVPSASDAHTEAHTVVYAPLVVPPSGTTTIKAPQVERTPKPEQPTVFLCPAPIDMNTLSKKQDAVSLRVLPLSAVLSYSQDDCSERIFEASLAAELLRSVMALANANIICDFLLAENPVLAALADTRVVAAVTILRQITADLKEKAKGTRGGREDGKGAAMTVVGVKAMKCEDGAGKNGTIGNEDTSRSSGSSVDSSGSGSNSATACGGAGGVDVKIEAGVLVAATKDEDVGEVHGRDGSVVEVGGEAVQPTVESQDGKGDEFELREGQAEPSHTSADATGDIAPTKGVESSEIGKSAVANTNTNTETINDNTQGTGGGNSGGGVNGNGSVSGSSGGNGGVDDERGDNINSGDDDSRAAVDETRLPWLHSLCENGSGCGVEANELSAGGTTGTEQLPLPLITESEAGQWQKRFLSACRWFDQQQSRILPVMHLKAILLSSTRNLSRIHLEDAIEFVIGKSDRGLRYEAFI